jgi:hypothetical protein
VYQVLSSLPPYGKRRFSPTFPGHWVIGECDDL